MADDATVSIMMCTDFREYTLSFFAGYCTYLFFDLSFELRAAGLPAGAEHDV